MLDVHPPHHATHGWRDFFIHIATIVVGLLIAVGLEQTVEFVHHRHQLRELREQMHGVLENNLESDALDFKMFADLRSSLLEIRAGTHAKNGETAPPYRKRSLLLFLRIPSVAPYEAAKENGTVALLSSPEIRIFNRLALQREFQLSAIRDWNDAMRDLDSFEERFVDFSGVTLFGNTMPEVKVSELSLEQREEYSRLVATLIKRTDILSARVRLFDRQCRLVLDGAQDESSLFVATQNL